MSDDRPVYLDHNATTPVDPAVVDAMEPYLRTHFGNPSSRHTYGEKAQEAVDLARHRVAEFLGAQPDEIIFVSGGTEANNLAIRGFAGTRDHPTHLITSTIEHSAVAEPCTRLEKDGWHVDRIPVRNGGRLDVDTLTSCMTDDTAFATIMHGNNETGVIQPIDAVADCASDHDVTLHTDAAQTAGKLPLDVDDLGVDLLSIAGHKMYAPKGIGALYMRSGTSLKPLLSGAGHERGCRPGTEPVPAIVALGKAAQIADDTLDSQRTRQTGLRNRLHERLADQIPGLAVNGHPEARLPNTLNVRFPDVSGRRLLDQTPEVAASTGSACHEGAGSASAVLQQLDLDRSQALSSVRLSLGRHTTPDDIDRAADALATSWHTLIAQ